MMRLPPFTLHLPETVDDAVAIHARHPGAMYIAGGTDLLPNLKHRLYDAEHLVSLSRLPLGELAVGEDGGLTLGAGLVLSDLADASLLHEMLPALAHAASEVAGPLQRNRATLGGNVMLDTRCVFYNQTPAWRQALGHCLKKDGTHCHVIGSERRCVAVRSGDTVPLLVALDAVLQLATPGGPRTLPIRELYGRDGRVGQHLRVGPSDLLVGLRIPPSPGRRLATYRKVRRRRSIDFAQLGLAVVVDVVAGRVGGIVAVLGALMPAPRTLTGWEVALGTRLEDEVIDALVASVSRQARAQASVHGATRWRKEVARVEVRRALLELRADL